MNTQPEALRLADALETYDICASVEAMPDLDVVAAELRRLHELVEHLQLMVFGFETKLATRGYEIQIDDLKEELRRLQALNADLLSVITDFKKAADAQDPQFDGDAWLLRVDAAIAKATGEQA